MARMWRPVWRSVLGSVARKYQNADPGVGGGGFSPASLFASGEQGIWLDPSDFSTMFQDSAGTTPVTAVGQPVGLALDKRLGLVEQADTVIHPVSGSTSGLWAHSADTVLRNGSSTGQSTVITTALAATKKYWLRFTVTGFSGDPFTMHVGGSNIGAISANGDYKFLVSGTGAAVLTVIPWGGAVGQATISAISIKELPGNHASQPTAAARSVLEQTGAYYYQNSDGVDDSVATAAGGGATTSAVIVMGFRTAAIGAAQTLFSDRSGNTGLKLEVTAGGNIAFSGGNGASINTATGAAVSANTDYVVTAKYDGTNLSVQLNRGTATTTACALSAGTAAITLGKDNGAATGFHNGRRYGTVYVKNTAKSAGEIASAEAYMAAKMGVTL